MSLPSERTTFLSLIVDLLNECESRMFGQDYPVLENLLERLHSVRNGCKRVANLLGFTAEMQLNWTRLPQRSEFPVKVYRELVIASRKSYVILMPLLMCLLGFPKPSFTDLV